MPENIINYNEKILSNYQKNYPNLADFSYDIQNDSLVYNGNFVKLNGYGLSRIDPVFFLMNPEDIYTYFKNGFYQNTNKNAQIQEYFNQLIITEDEEETIQKYVYQYIEMINIYARNAQFFLEHLNNESIKDFVQNFKDAKTIIEDARKMANPDVYNAYQIINNAYNNEMHHMNQNTTNTESKQMVLSRTKQFGGYSEFDKNEEYLKKLNQQDKLGMKGFTSLILLITSAITAGMFLALKLLG